MTLLLDVNHVIMPIDMDIKKNIINNIDNMLENLIIDNNQIFNTYILNHILYYNTDTIFEKKTIESCKKYLASYIKKHKIYFRANNKKNKFNLGDINEFINTFIKLVQRINNIMIHVKSNNNKEILKDIPKDIPKDIKKDITKDIPKDIPKDITKDITKDIPKDIPKDITKDIPKDPLYVWGCSDIINTSLVNLCNILLNDNIIEIALTKNIIAHENIERNNDMYRFIKYINNLSSYDMSYASGNISSKIHNMIDDIMVKCIPACDYMIEENMLQVYKFKSIYKYYKNNNNKYYYIKSKNNTMELFPKLNKMIEMNLIKIISSEDINFIENFIIIYKKILSNLHQTIDMMYLLTNKKIDSLESMILYYSTLYEIAETNNTISNNNTGRKIFDEIIISQCIENQMNKYNDSPHIKILVDLISFDIINKKSRKILYIVGSKLKNKDEFILLLCQKLKYRIVYSDIDMMIEISHHDLLKKYFMVKECYNYNVIMDDLNVNLELNNMRQVSNNIKMIITSLNSWHINHKTGHVKQIESTGIFTKMLHSTFTDCNKILACKQQHLILYPHMGIVDCTIKNSNIIMTPLHMICLEQFDNIKKEKIHNSYTMILQKMKLSLSSAYNDEYLNNIIFSLIIGKVLLLCDNTIHYTKNIMCINDNIPSYVNLIECFNNIENYETEKYKEVILELAHDRNDIIMCNINSILKKNCNNMIECFERCKKNITLFEVTSVLYETALECMITKNLITRNDDIISLS